MNSAWARLLWAVEVHAIWWSVVAPGVHMGILLWHSATLLEPEQQVTSLDIGILVFNGCAFLLVSVPNRTRHVNELAVLLLRRMS